MDHKRKPVRESMTAEEALDEVIELWKWGEVSSMEEKLRDLIAGRIRIVPPRRRVGLADCEVRRLAILRAYRLANGVDATLVWWDDVRGNPAYTEQVDAIAAAIRREMEGKK